MRYLLDTHAFLWHFDGSDKLSETAVSVIENADIQKHISIASIWEFAIKYSTGKIGFEGGISRLWEIITRSGFAILPIKQSHLAGIIDLPFIHRDPFDRLFVAIAKAEGMTILTADENIHKYDVPSVW